MEDMQLLGKQAKEAAATLVGISTKEKNKALSVMADLLTAKKNLILNANEKDVELAKQNGITGALLDRLTLNESRLDAIISDLRNVISLPDPVGEEFDTRVLENGLKLTKRRVPLGVIGVIYEARPNVTVDITALSLKTGNACILRGGKETLQTNLLVVDIIQTALEKCGMSKYAVQYIKDPARDYVTELLHLDQYVDMIIPRGGKSLHELCRKESTIPVIIGGFGVGHIYVDESADLDKSVEIIDNSKTQKPSACNSVDTVLVHQNIADAFLPKLAERMKQKGVTLVCHNQAGFYLKQVAGVKTEPGKEEDFDTEWLSLTMNVTIVGGLDEALTHLRVHNACHSDAILTNDYKNALTFVNTVGSACAYINASTRFSDGAQFGLGAEVAISTQKLHARGPMGLKELTSYKWIAEGDYVTRK